MIERASGAPRAPEGRTPDDDGVQGIMLAGARWSPEGPQEPRITAFIWGGKVRPTPILPYGRWKGAA